MAVDTIQLPKSKTAICRLLERHATREELRLRYRRMMWLLCWYYLNGARRFDIVDPYTGVVHPHYLDENGNMEFQCQDLLYLINRTAARLASMDYRPKVNTSGGSLSAMRERSTAQVVMDSVTREDHLFRVKRDFAFIYTCLGSCGISSQIVDHPTIGLSLDLEVVHPREIMPFPSLGQDHTKKRGLMRYRAVPLDYLVETFGSRMKSEKNLARMDYWRNTIGDTVSEFHTNQPGVYMGGSLRAFGAADPNTPKEEEQIIVRIKEVWMDGPFDTCARYIIASGDELIEDQDFKGREMYCPIGFERFYETGAFHGAGLFDVMFPMARQLELNLKQLFNNIRDLDQYGILVIPSGQFNERSVLKNVGHGLRALPWEPDPMTEGFKPFPIEPYNTGETPAKVAQLARSLLQSLDPTPDISDQKGRVDSASGLQFLEDQANKALTFPAQGCERAFSTMYRAGAAMAVEELSFSPRPLPVTRLTLDLAGAVIDPENQNVTFPANPIPDLSRMSFTIRDMNPRSEAARKAEALQLTKEQIQDRNSLLLYAIQSGLDLAMYMDEEKNAYESVVRNILLTYGDGTNPGQIVVTPETVKPELQLRILTAFMASPKMAVASPQVVDSFAEYREFLMMQMGAILPQGVPNPDDMANQMANQGAPQGVGSA